MLKNIWKKIKQKGYFYHSLYWIYGIGISYILFINFNKVYELRELYNLKVLFIFYTVFFGIYGPYKRIKLKEYIIRMIISTLIILVLFTVFRRKL